MTTNSLTTGNTLICEVQKKRRRVNFNRRIHFAVNYSSSPLSNDLQLEGNEERQSISNTNSAVKERLQIQAKRKK